MKSIIRWIGGKGRIAEQVMNQFPSSMEVYYEPFVGGGSILLNVLEQKLCKSAIAGDANEELINFYLQIKKDYRAVLDTFDTFENSEKEFYRIRKLDRDPGWSQVDPVFRAARFWYITKMFFNGLWRVNKDGFNNSPYGKIKKIGYDEQDVKGVAEALRNTDFKACDFAKLIETAKEGDMVYLDPPYVPISDDKDSFTLYIKEGFDADQHLNLRKACDELNKKKVKFLLSNSCCERTRQLFDGYSFIEIVVRRSVAASSASRGDIKELLIKNY